MIIKYKVTVLPFVLRTIRACLAALRERRANDQGKIDCGSRDMCYSEKISEIGDTCIPLKQFRVIAVDSPSGYNFPVTARRIFRHSRVEICRARDDSSDTRFMFTEHVLHAHNK